MLIKPDVNKFAKIKVLGLGGGGTNALNSMISQAQIQGVDFVAVNTDQQHLLASVAQTKVQIGDGITKGLGAGADPEIGRRAAEESLERIKEVITGADMAFLTYGAGGGTGTGGGPIIADLARKMGILTVAVITKPFAFEGTRRMIVADEGIENLRDKVDTLIVIPNQKLLEVVDKNVPLLEAFKLADSILAQGVQGISDIIVMPGLINVDFADVKTIMSDGGVSLIGVGESDSAQRAHEAVERALNNPLLDVDISNATGALVNIIGGPDLSLEESKVVIEEIGKHLGDNARLIWGAQISPDMEKTMRVMVIVTGVRSPQILGSEVKQTKEEKVQGELSNELGIKFFR